MSGSDIAQEIRRRGFRRWYERQLTESFAYLVTGFLALILLLAGFEAMGAIRDLPVYYVAIVLVAGGAGTLTWVAWQRFTTLLARAELFANAAACPGCRAWGRFEVIGAEAAAADDPPEAGRPHWVLVCCKRCGERWRLG